MNVRLQGRDSASQTQLLKNASFEPVFNAEGEIVDIREMKISTDRRSGLAAMRELFETVEPGDEIAYGDGLTGKQKRILRTPAPLGAHYLKHSKKWDARTGEMRDAALILLPFEVVWDFFENLFAGQYSLRIGTIHREDEEIAPQGGDADDAPGRRFYSEVTVSIDLHLPGQAAPRTYEGVGVSYGSLTMEKTSNIFAINSERRTTDKGAVSDAKREALSSLGPVFRRAFEDGDEMVEFVERLLLDKIRAANRPAIHKVSAERQAVPAPAPKRQAAPVAKTTEAETDGAPVPSGEETSAPAKDMAQANRVSVRIPGEPERMVDVASFAEDLLDIVFEVASSADTVEAILAENAELVARHVADKGPFEEVIASLKGEEGDGIPDFDETPAAEEGTASAGKSVRVDVAGKSGKALLGEISALIDAARSSDEINGIVKENPEALRKLTPKQMGSLTEHRSKREKSLSS